MADEAVEIQYSADMRYLDQIYEVTVPLPNATLPDAEFIARLTSNFHGRYQELYSYAQQDQECGWSPCGQRPSASSPG